LNLVETIAPETSEVRADGRGCLPVGDMARLIAAMDWSKTPLGARDRWPRNLEFSVQIILAAGFPMAVRWGSELTMIYNDAYRAILGDKHPQVLGRPLREVWPEIYPKVGPLHEQILQGSRSAYFSDDQVWTIQRRGLRFEDARFAVSYSPIPDDRAPSGVGGVLVTAIETTDRFGSEEALRDRTQSLETEVTERTRERGRIWQVSEDLLGVSTFDGYFIMVNPAWSKLLGWSEPEIKSMHISQLRHPDDAAHSEAARRRLAEGVASVHIENRFRDKDGSWHWLHWTMTHERGLIYVIGKDITAERVANDKLKESERQFRLLVDGVIDYALYMLDPAGTVASWNSGAQRIKGYSSDDIIGKHFSQFYTEEDRADGVPWRALDTARKEGRYIAEGWRLRKDGTRFWASVAIDAIRDETGELVGFAKITRDVTERRNSELGFAQTQRQLAYAQKMEALGQLTGGVAHDFNNMLMVISGQAQALLGRLSDARDLRSARAIALAADRGETLTRQLLAFSRRQSLNPTPIRLRERFEEFREILLSSARQDIRVTIDIDDAVWPVAVDISELQLAVVNIVVNARDAMPNGGSLVITAENLTAAEGELPDELSGDFVAIEITDTGTGIPEEVLPRIFEPFFTTKQQERGTGLGLSQLYGFARQSGGTVAIASKVGQGTTVTLYLPRTTREVIQTDKAATMVPKGAGNGAAILVVEDNPHVSDVAAELIESLGYRVVSADCGVAALEILKSGKPFHLVFSDVVLPGELDGFALAQRIKESYPDLPVLLTTGYSRASAPSKYPILRKPYQLASLASAIRGAIAGDATLFS
jgi:PAS domain S-box-containing protein